MQLIRTGHGMAALLGVALALVAFSALAEGVAAEITLKPPRNAADIIRGHGGADGLTAAGMRNYIALTRAEARASALEPFLRADLDGDGAVTGDEAQVYAGSLSARARARFGKAMDLADQDLNGGLTGAEIAAAGLDAAWNAIDAEDKAALSGLLALDADGNAAIDLEELRQGLAKARATAKPSQTEDDA